MSLEDDIKALEKLESDLMSGKVKPVIGTNTKLFIGDKEVFSSIDLGSDILTEIVGEQRKLNESEGDK